MPRSGFRHFFSLATIALLVSACSGTETTTDATSGGPVGDADLSTVDGLLLMATGTDVHIVDPRTGTPSPFAIPTTPASATSGRYDVSPDGQLLAVATPAPSGDEPGLALFSFDFTEDGAPTFVEVGRWPGISGGEVRFNTLGDRIATRLGWFHVDTQEFEECPRDARPGQLRDLVQFSVDGRRWQCGGVWPLSTPDGQWEERTHQPSRATLVDEIVGWGDYRGDSFTIAISPQGEVLTLDAGTDGQIVREEAGGTFGEELITRIVTVSDSPSFARAYPLADILDAREWFSDTPFDLLAALQPHLSLGDGRRWNAAGVAPDGERVIYHVSSWFISSTTIGDRTFSQETPGPAAFVAIDRDGTSSSIVSTEPLASAGVGGNPTTDAAVGNSTTPWMLPDPYRHHGLVWFGDDWFNGAVGVWGDAIWSAQGAMSQDGRWMMRSAPARTSEDRPQHCLREVGPSGGESCFEAVTGGQPVRLVAPGIHGDAAPSIWSISRAAAWPGAEVVLSGAGFRDGSSGARRVMVGGVAVPSDAIVSWSEHRIVFTMAESLPEAGEVVVEVDGRTSSGRSIWLSRTRRIRTPFDGVERDGFALGQGINLVDFGEIELEDPIRVADDLIRAELEWRLPNGYYPVVSPGAAEPMELSVDVVHEGYRGSLEFVVEDRVADPSSWTLVSNLSRTRRDLISLHAMGDVVIDVERNMAFRVEGERLASYPLRRSNPAQSEIGVPDFFVLDDRGMWSLFSEHGSATTIRLIDGWEVSEGDLLPTLVDDVALELPRGLTRFGVNGTTVLAVDGFPEGEPPAWAVSRDGGPFGAVSNGAGTLPEDVALVMPVPVTWDGQDGFAVFEMSLETLRPGAVHFVALDGTLTPEIAPAAPGLLAGVEATDVWSHRSLVVVRSGHERPLMVLDLANDEPAWLEPFDGADSVRSLTRASSGELVAVTADGVVWRSDSSWTSWMEEVVDIDPVIAGRFDPYAATILPDGRLAVQTQAFAPGEDDGAAWLLGSDAWFVSPLSP